ncbi:hypothetical protein LIS90_12195 [Flavobacterium psychrophilum]|uniref:hypothetical protein n=1 Tax=Flavobacterium psychrophilum TaxID=96345 RepID=UPI001D07D40D|nr:hypothetical protein [Flavobacterium psychrophilum]MCB6232008.1 hypothetical protein [Flavobacterium psychrophilum]
MLEDNTTSDIKSFKNHLIKGLEKGGYDPVLTLGLILYSNPEKIIIIIGTINKEKTNKNNFSKEVS